MTRGSNALFQAIRLTPLALPPAQPRRRSRSVAAMAIFAGILAVALLAAWVISAVPTLETARAAAIAASPAGAAFQAVPRPHEHSAAQPAPAWIGAAPDNDVLQGLLSLAVNLGIVLALLYGTLWLLRRFGPGGLAHRTRSIRVIESASLGQGRSLVVVEAGDRRLLLGVTAQHISLVSELPAEDAPLPDSHT
jgi:flagellar protein FliO/FliZ